MATDASSVLSDDLSDYDVISNPGQRSVESSIADLDHIPALVPSEPAISHAAREQFYTASLSAENIQAYVRKALCLPPSPNVEGQPSRTGNGCDNRTLRVYVDGIFDGFNTG
jgi:choline-phosphate cytidylyltransferase